MIDYSIIEPMEKSIPYNELAKCGFILWHDSADHQGDCHQGLIVWELAIAGQPLTKFVSPSVIFNFFQHSFFNENSPFQAIFVGIETAINQRSWKLNEGGGRINRFFSQIVAIGRNKVKKEVSCISQ